MRRSPNCSKIVEDRVDKQVKLGIYPRPVAGTAGQVFDLGARIFQAFTDRWPSGLRRTPGTRVYVKAYRGFESLSVRHMPPLLQPPVDIRLPPITPAARAFWLDVDGIAADDGLHIRRFVLQSRRRKFRSARACRRQPGSEERSSCPSLLLVEETPSGEHLLGRE
jgi:hypothetical protein